MARWDKGNQNTIPDWFWQAVDVEAEARHVEVEECDVAYRYYPAEGKPGLVFIHGMNAHSRWWDFIAPQLLNDYAVAAMDLTGMGDSDYRYNYASATYAKEIKAVIEHAGFGPNAMVVAHSFGGYMAVKAANLYPEIFAGLVLVDSGIRHPDEPAPDRGEMGGGRAKVYPDKASAVQRFRLFPAQPCENEYIVEYIGRHSVMPVEGGGWSWKFDEDLLTTLTETDRQADDYRELAIPLGVIYGEISESFSATTLAYMQSLVPFEFPAVGIADAQHHVFLDQPEAFVTTLRQMLADIQPAR